MTERPCRYNSTRPSIAEALHALLSAEYVWRAAQQLEDLYPRHEPRGGRPRRYPLAAALIWNALVSGEVFGSSRQVANELSCPLTTWWDTIRKRLIEHYPDVDVPIEPMRRHHFEWLRKNYLTSTEARALTSVVLLQVTCAMAPTMGICDPASDGSLTHPSPDRSLVGDGKVIRVRYKTHPKKRRVVDRATGEVRYKRADPDASNHTVGGGGIAFGTKFVFASARSSEPGCRLIFGVEPDPPKRKGGEAATALALFDRVLPLLPGAQALAYDGAFRGTHLGHIMKRHGIPAISRLHESSKDRRLGQVEVHQGTVSHVEIHLVDGAPCIRRVTVDGDITLVPLEGRRSLRRPSGSSWRLFVEYDLPESEGGGFIRLRLDRTREDIEKGFNREEYLRAIPPGDPDHAAIYGRRNDTESGNRVLDDSMLRERAHTVGHERQHLDLMTWAMVRNAVAYFRFRRDEGPPT